MRKKTHEEFVQEIFNLVGDEYKLIGDYMNASTPIEIEHKVCNYKYRVRPKNFLQGNRCPKCNTNRIKTTQDFKQEVFNLVENEYTVVTEYSHAHAKVKFSHNIPSCDCEFEMTPSAFLHSGNRCPYCGIKRVADKLRKTNDEFKQVVYNLVGDEYTVVGDYERYNSKLKIKHSKCNRTYEVTPSHFIEGNRCPSCKTSKGEEKILNYLKENKILYEHQYKFDDCKDKRSLPFDFCIFSKENKLICLIEYDGEQHFKPVEYFGGIEKFKKQVRNDQIKNQYCRENNIPFYRIPYWYFDRIEEILNKLIHNEHLEVDKTSFLVQLK